MATARKAQKKEPTYWCNYTLDGVRRTEIFARAKSMVEARVMWKGSHKYDGAELLSVEIKE